MEVVWSLYWLTTKRVVQFSHAENGNFQLMRKKLKQTKEEIHKVYGVTVTSLQKGKSNDLSIKTSTPEGFCKRFRGLLAQLSSLVLRETGLSARSAGSRGNAGWPWALSEESNAAMVVWKFLVPPLRGGRSFSQGASVAGHCPSRCHFGVSPQWEGEHWLLGLVTSCFTCACKQILMEEVHSDPWKEGLGAFGQSTAWAPEK